MRRALTIIATSLALAFAGCSSIGLVIQIPIGVGSIGVGVDSSGRVSGQVGVGRGGVSVGVGGTAQLPPPEPAASGPWP